MYEKQRNLIENDFSLNKQNKCIELKFFQEFPSQKFSYHVKNLVFHENYKDSSSIVNEWSKKIYSNKMDPKNYTLMTFQECHHAIFLF